MLFSKEYIWLRKKGFAKQTETKKEGICQTNWYFHCFEFHDLAS